MIQSFKSMVPVVDETAYVHPMATVIGHVTIGKNCYIGPGAVLRGDWGKIEVSNGCNIQENCVVHMFPGTTVRLEEGAHVGHGAIVHGAKLGRQCMIGMNAVIMDDVEVGEGCIVGALSFLKAQSQWKDRTIIAGNPAKILGEVSDDMLAHKVEGTRLYQGLPADFHSSLRECEPLRAEPLDQPSEFPDFETWQQRRKRK
ncbi:transferase hexapeptide repeat family protein [Flavobacteriales bacterium]|nr:transferase hexapeptide repeat family protein [Flavobacteriales bacterium]